MPTSDEEKAEALAWLVRIHKNWAKFKGGLYTALGTGLGVLLWDVFVGF